MTYQLMLDVRLSYNYADDALLCTTVRTVDHCHKLQADLYSL